MQNKLNTTMARSVFISTRLLKLLNNLSSELFGAKSLDLMEPKELSSPDSLPISQPEPWAASSESCYTLKEID